MNLSKLFSLAGLAELLLQTVISKHLPDYWPLSEKYHVRVCELAFE